MKRVLAAMIIFVIMVAVMPVTAMAEGYLTEAFVDVTTCTLRKTPTADTRAENSFAKLENGFTMMVVGESGDYFVIQPSSFCNRAG